MRRGTQATGPEVGVGPGSSPDPVAARERTGSAVSSRDRTIIRVLTVAAFIVILNETITVNAVPRLAQEFAVTPTTAQWLTSGFMLTMAVVIPASGWVIQRLGTRRTFLAAMSTFSVGTALCALAPVFPLLLLGRVVQATGTAVMVPLVMTTLLTLVPLSERGRTMGNVTLVISVAPALGPALSGLVLQVAGWRWLFGLVLPLALLMTFWGGRLLGDVAARGRDRLDLLSVLLTVVGFGFSVYALSALGGGGHGTGGEAGGATEQATGAGSAPWVALALGLVGVALFVWRQLTLQRRERRPLLDLRVLRVPTFVTALGILCLGFMALMSAMVLLPLYLQSARGLDELPAGLMLAPGGIAMGLLGPVVGRLYDRVGARPLIVPGASLLLLALGGLAAALLLDAPYWVILLAHVSTSLSLALIFTPVFTAGLGGLPKHLYGDGSATVSSLQQVAAAAGSALVITVMSLRQGQLIAQGESVEQALGHGVGTAVLVGVGLAAVVLVLTLLQRTPPPEQAADDVPADAVARD